MTVASVMHMVLVEWALGSPEGVGDEASRLVDTQLRHLDGVLSIHRGPSVSIEGLEGRTDWAMAILFAGPESVEAYLPHPDHRVVADFLGAHAATVTVFDVAG
ncbi:Dabb family protein [Actinotalea sp. M2MS4P-6]|uniref:Dabb family protein n=1 Tax=Actinotalea sp. M2MS4P-6 TaxID=2983762 RepID=UPI0021E3C2B5|nr:Dabb family protein [Actinotalea sp. M2MS4P-6]MCV2395639.1 Dabb family protein [Actinotalea sp. M2MS4P-6]